MVRTRRTQLLLAGADAALLVSLTGCAGGAAAPEAEGTPSSAASTPAETSTAPASTPTSSSPAAAAAGTLTIPQPINGLTEFPVPAGATTVDLGGVVNGSYQVGLSGVTTQELVAFYQEVLSAQGYAVAADVSDGAVQYDLAFSGPVYGVVGDLLGQPYVTLSERPTSGINP